MRFSWIMLLALPAVGWPVTTTTGVADEHLIQDERNTQQTGKKIEPEDSIDRLFGSAVLNPSGAAPLTAEIPFTPDMPGTVSITITCPEVKEDREEAVSASFSFTAGKQILLPVLGLYADRVNMVTVTLYGERGEERGAHTQSIATGPLPKDFPRVTTTGTCQSNTMTFVTYFRTHVRTEEDETFDGAPRIMQRAIPEITGIVFDQWGSVRWYSSFPYNCLFPMELIDGCIYGGDWITDLGLLQWYDLMGRQAGKIDLEPLGFARIHHDVIRKPNGNLILTADRLGGDYVEDHVIEVDPIRGRLIRTWDLCAVLPDVADLYRDVPMTGMETPGFSNDPIHVNGVAWDATDGSIIVTCQRSGVAKLRNDGTLAWLLAPHLTRYIDDANGDAVSDSLAANYDPSNRRTWIGNYRGDNYVHERVPVAGKPSAGYPFDFNYGEFLLSPLDRDSVPITDRAVLLGFAKRPDFSWPFRPHAPRLMKDGTLLLFDNGFSRGFRAIREDSFSRAVLFQVVPDDDGFGGTVTQTGEYILKSDPPWHRFSAMVSDVDELANGNLLITLGGLGSGLYPPPIRARYGNGPRGAYIAEVASTTGEEQHSLLIERVIDDNHPNGPFTAYRAERINLYEALGSTTALTRLATAP